MQIKKIKRMRNTLAELRPGLAFTMGDDRICMKVRMGTMPEEMVVRFPDHHFVVDLESGAFRELEKTTLVEPVTCTVSVERRWA